ncbi:MAG: ABC transporter ATP-binding protein, partial [Aquiluna sp.]
DQYLQLKVPKKQAQSKQVRSEELTGAERRNLEKESARLERLIAKTETELTQLQLEMAEADQSDHEVLSELSGKERDLRSEIEKAEQTWLEVAQKLQQ